MNCNQSDWLDIFCPTEKDDLAVHPKKLQELEQWLLEASRSKKKLAILTGPPGCGKTASIRVLANKNGFYIQEWSNCTENKLRFDGEVEWQSEELHFSQSDAFKNFLFKASRYGSVLEPHNKRRIILIEDLPNAIQKDFNTYYTIFTEYLQHWGKSPLVLIISEGNDAPECHSQLLDRLKEQDMCVHINFNPIANTFMQRAMKKVIARFKSTTMSNHSLPNENILNSIVISSHGDIRNALVNLHFASLKGCPSVKTIMINVGKTVPTKHKRTAVRQDSKLKSIGTNESLSLPHAIGRILNPKFDARNYLVYEPKDIIELFQSQPKRFFYLLHANYDQHFSEMESLAIAADYFSICSSLLEAYYNAEVMTVGFDVIVRGLMVNNKKPTTKWKPLKGCQKDNSGNTLNGVIYSANKHGVSSRVFVHDYKPFLEIMSSKHK